MRRSGRRREGRWSGRPAEADRPVQASIFESSLDELLHPELAIWRANVGEPVALDLAPPGPRRIEGLDILCWNVAIGAGRLAELLELLVGGAFQGLGAHPARPLIVLLQEAYRADDSVPADARRGYHGGARHARSADDVVEVARAAGMSLRYAPSMRNGAHRSDRGNAILSTVPFAISHAFALPYIRQRRVVVSAELEAVPHMALISAHLDVRGQSREGRVRIRAFGGGRVLQATALLRQIEDRRRDHCVVIGADLNTQLGARDPVLRTFAANGLHLATRTGGWRHTYHGPLSLDLDHVLFRSPTGRIERVLVSRLDERAGDRGRRVFGSDHHPLLARVDFREPVYLA